MIRHSARRLGVGWLSVLPFASTLALAEPALAQSGAPWFETRAEPGATSGASPAVEQDQPEDTDPELEDADAPLPPQQRPFLYLVDPSLPAPLRANVSYSAGYASTDATRPLAATTHRSGFVNELGLEVGVHERLAPYVAGLLAPPLSGEPAARTAFRAGLRGLLTDPRSQGLRLALSAGYLRDFEQISAATGELTATFDIQRVRLAGMMHAEKAFAENRDAVDFYSVLGASVAVLPSLRLGAEYVGQDLEDAWEDEEAEGGIRHFAGANIAYSHDDTLLVTAGPAFGLSAAAPDVAGRASVTYSF